MTCNGENPSASPYGKHDWSILIILHEFPESRVFLFQGLNSRKLEANPRVLLSTK